jgi:hypothetical protein
MWGRLDAAERLIDTLLPSTVADDVRDGMIHDAHLAIVHEERESVFADRKETDEELLAWIRSSYSVDLTLDQQAMLGVAGRGLHVTQQVLGGLDADGRKASTLASIAARVGTPLVGIVRLALLRSARVAAWLFVAAAAVLIAAGAVASADPAARTGWALLPYALTVAVGLEIVNRRVAGFFQVTKKRPPAASTGRRILHWCVVVLAILWVLLLFVFVPVALLSDAVRDAMSFLPGWG